ncbi:hypothetical protein BDV95DRAFT_643201 [Massariosphaeria phaeospora]|uniref:Uncharacterized protein n=1 Tax=Massariosphaeria phaeospora TaxID=100035 RepID=A0A7C8I6I1_9PLEO|nr:hypothetical protein BDV95DRAFT_643201 [Massariosphaeria phaeospora]
MASHPTEAATDAFSPAQKQVLNSIERGLMAQKSIDHNELMSFMETAVHLLIPSRGPHQPEDALTLILRASQDDGFLALLDGVPIEACLTLELGFMKAIPDAMRRAKYLNFKAVFQQLFAQLAEEPRKQPSSLAPKTPEVLALFVERRCALLAMGVKTEATTKARYAQQVGQVESFVRNMVNTGVTSLSRTIQHAVLSRQFPELTIGNHELGLPEAATKYRDHDRHTEVQSTPQQELWSPKDGVVRDQDATVIAEYIDPDSVAPNAPTSSGFGDGIEPQDSGLSVPEITVGVEKLVIFWEDAESLVSLVAAERLQSPWNVLAINETSRASSASRTTANPAAGVGQSVAASTGSGTPSTTPDSSTAPSSPDSNASIGPWKDVEMSGAPEDGVTSIGTAALPNTSELSVTWKDAKMGDAPEDGVTSVASASTPDSEASTENVAMSGVLPGGATSIGSGPSTTAPDPNLSMETSTDTEMSGAPEEGVMSIPPPTTSDTTTMPDVMNEDEPSRNLAPQAPYVAPVFAAFYLTLEEDPSSVGPESAPHDEDEMTDVLQAPATASSSSMVSVLNCDEHSLPPGFDCRWLHDERFAGRLRCDMNDILYKMPGLSAMVTNSIQNTHDYRQVASKLVAAANRGGISKEQFTGLGRYAIEDMPVDPATTTSEVSYSNPFENLSRGTPSSGALRYSIGIELLDGEAPSEVYRKMTAMIQAVVDHDLHLDEPKAKTWHDVIYPALKEIRGERFTPLHPQMTGVHPKTRVESLRTLFCTMRNSNLALANIGMPHFVWRELISRAQEMELECLGKCHSEKNYDTRIRWKINWWKDQMNISRLTSELHRPRQSMAMEISIPEPSSSAAAAVQQLPPAPAPQVAAPLAAVAVPAPQVALQTATPQPSTAVNAPSSSVATGGKRNRGRDTEPQGYSAKKVMTEAPTRDDGQVAMTEAV